MSTYYLYIGGLLNEGEDEFLDYSIKVEVSENFEERSDCVEVNNSYQFAYYDIYEIQSNENGESEQLAKYFENKILFLFDKERHHNSEFLKFKDKIEVNGFTQRIHSIIMGISRFIYPRIKINHIEKENNTSRTEKNKSEKARFNREFISLLPQTNKEIIGLGTFSYKAKLDIHDDDAVYNRFKCCWYTNQNRAGECQYGILFHNQKIVALFEIKKIIYREEYQRIEIEATRCKDYDHRFPTSEYDMFVANPVIYLTPSSISYGDATPKVALRA